MTTTIANLYIAVDPLKVEAARVAVVKAVEGMESAYGRWIKVAEAVKAAWPADGLADKPLITTWVASGLSKAEHIVMADGYVEPFTEAVKAAQLAFNSVGSEDNKKRLAKEKAFEDKAKAERKAAQSKVSQYVKRVFEHAYPAPVIVQPAPELSPEQAEANEAQKIATQAAIDKGNASNAAAQAVTNSKIAKSEADTASLKAKAAEAAAKLDPSQAEAAAMAQAEAESKAEAAKVEAEKAEQAKAEAEAAKVLMVATQSEAKAKDAAVKASKMVEAILKDLDALIARVQGYKASIKGGDDLEAGLLGLKTDMLIDNSL